MNERIQIASELNDIARQMREREEQILHAIKQSKDTLYSVVPLIVEQGGATALVETKLGGVMTLDSWLTGNVPSLSTSRAKKYKRYAQAGVDERQVLLLGFSGEAPAHVQHEERPRWQVALTAFGRLRKIVRDGALDSFDDGKLTAARRELEPVAKKLWPERFE
jgi:hypothetical protein